MQKFSPEKKFDLLQNEPVGRAYFQSNGFAKRRILTQGQKGTWKWSIELKNNFTVSIIFP